MVVDPTTRAAWIVQGEADLGPQRRCKTCHSWWPLAEDFWIADRRTVTHRPGRPSERSRLPTPRTRVVFLQPCRACRHELNNGRLWAYKTRLREEAA